MKVCSKCGIEKSKSLFYKRAASPDGLCPHCKDCSSIYFKIYVEKNRDKVLGIYKSYYQKNKGKIKESQRIKMRQYRAENKELVRQREKKYRESTKESLREVRKSYRVKWEKNNPEKVIANCRKQSAKRYQRISVSGSYPPEWIDTLYKLQRGLCVYCRTPLGKKFHRDHILPLALGGTHTKENIQLLCPPCNHKKHAKHPIEFALTKGFLL